MVQYGTVPDSCERLWITRRKTRVRTAVILRKPCRQMVGVDPKTLAFGRHRMIPYSLRPRVSLRVCVFLCLPSLPSPCLRRLLRGAPGRVAHCQVSQRGFPMAHKVSFRRALCLQRMMGQMIPAGTGPSKSSASCWRPSLACCLSPILPEESILPDGSCPTRRLASTMYP